MPFIISLETAQHSNNQTVTQNFKFRIKSQLLKQKKFILTTIPCFIKRNNVMIVDILKHLRETIQ